jgi:hypothetical protein
MAIKRPSTDYRKTHLGKKSNVLVVGLVVTEPVIDHGTLPCVRRGSGFHT